MTYNPNSICRLTISSGVLVLGTLTKALMSSLRHIHNPYYKGPCAPVVYAYILRLYRTYVRSGLLSDLFCLSGYMDP